MADTITGYEEIIVEVGGQGFSEVTGLDIATAEQLFIKRGDPISMSQVAGLATALGTKLDTSNLATLNTAIATAQKAGTDAAAAAATADGKAVAAKTAADNAATAASNAATSATNASRITRNTVNQPAHGFIPGNVVAFFGGKWQKAIANPVSSPWFGVVGDAIPTLAGGADNFNLITQGRVYVVAPSGVTLANGMMLYLSRTEAGKWQTAGPTATEFDAFRQAVIVTDAAAVPAIGLIVPFRRRLSPFRLMTAQPAGAGSISHIVSPSAGVLLCGRGRTVYRYTVDGDKWDAVYTPSDAGLTSISDLLITGGVVALSFGGTAALRQWVMESSNGGVTWANASSAAWGSAAIAVSGPYRTGTTKWAFTSGSGAPIYRIVPTQNTAYQNYINVGSGETSVGYVLFDGTYFFVGMGSGKLYRISTSGAGNTTAYATLPAAIQCLALNSGTMWAGAGAKVHIAAAPYNSWSAGVGLAGATVVNCIQPYKDSIYAGADSGLYVSTDNGATFALLYPGGVTAMWADGTQLIAAIGGQLYTYAA